MGDEFFLVEGFAELAAAGLGGLGLVVVAHRMQGDDLGRHGLLICGRQRLPRLSRLARGPAGSPGLRLLGGRGLRHRTEKGLERRTRRVLLGLLLGRAVARAQRLRAGEDDRRVLALVAYSRAFAVVHRRLAETFLSDLLELALE